MRYLNETLAQSDASKATLRFRRAGSTEWEVRPGINSVRKYIEAVGDKPDPNGFHLGSQWGRGEWSGEAMPEFDSWRIQTADGGWRRLTLEDMA